MIQAENLVEGEEGQYGLFMTSVDGEKADDSKQQWWCLTKGGEQVNTSADQTPIAVSYTHLDLRVLDKVSFQIKKGEFVCIVGPTGCGKTTFLRLLTKLTEPTSGEIYIDGEPADPQKHNISFVFQEPSAFPWLTAEENIEYGLKVKKRPAREIKAQSDKIIGLLGLEKFRKAYPHEMSVSMEQRVVIGRAFAMNPDLLLMDEPYGQMDIKMRYFLEDEVIKLWKATGLSLIHI